MQISPKTLPYLYLIKQFFYKVFLQDFLARLNKTENGKYTIHLDYPSADQILNYCVVEETRKIFAKAFKKIALIQRMFLFYNV